MFILRFFFSRHIKGYSIKTQLYFFFLQKTLFIKVVLYFLPYLNQNFVVNRSYFFFIETYINTIKILKSKKHNNGLQRFCHLIKHKRLCKFLFKLLFFHRRLFFTRVPSGTRYIKFQGLSRAKALHLSFVINDHSFFILPHYIPVYKGIKY